MTAEDHERWMAEALRIYGHAIGSPSNHEAVANALGAIADVLTQNEDPVISVYAVKSDGPDQTPDTLRDGDVRYNYELYPRTIERFAQEAEQAGLDTVLRFFSKEGVINGLLVQHEGKTIRSIGNVT